MSGLRELSTVKFCCAYHLLAMSLWVLPTGWTVVLRCFLMEWLWNSKVWYFSGSVDRIVQVYMFCDWLWFLKHNQSSGSVGLQPWIIAGSSNQADQQSISDQTDHDFSVYNSYCQSQKLPAFSSSKKRADKLDNISPVWSPNPAWIGALESPLSVGGSIKSTCQDTMTWMSSCGWKWRGLDYLTHDWPLWVHYMPWRASNALKAWMATCPSHCYISMGSSWVRHLFMHSRLNPHWYFD
jgi:hypothetical protein